MYIGHTSRSSSWPGGLGHSNVASLMRTPVSVSAPSATVALSGRERKRAIRPSERPASCSDCSTSGRKTSGERSRFTVASTVMAVLSVSDVW